MTDPYVFVSHKDDDKPKIRPIVEALLREDLAVWIDNPDSFRPPLIHAKLHRLEAGEHFVLTIPEHIQRAGCVLVIWSAAAVTSKSVLYEAKKALKQGTLVPVRIDEAMPPGELADVQTPRLDDDLSMDGAFGSLVDVIRRRMSTKPRSPLDGYRGLVRSGDHEIAFKPLVNRRKPMAATFRDDSVTIKRDWSVYTLPKEFEATEIEAPQHDLTSCRLVQWGIAKDAKLEITLSPVRYSDYLKSGENLDEPIPGDPQQRTFRESFASSIPEPDDSLRDFPLTNICGVGLFVVSNDKEPQVLVTRQPPSSHVYPKRWTFSASGIMQWGASPNPFTEVLWKCRREINHQVDPSCLELVEIGVDARKLFFEFCFVERAAVSASELVANLPSELKDSSVPSDPKYELVPLSAVGEVTRRITSRCWEPAAEATLLALVMQEHGVERTLTLLERKGNLRHHQMRDEWDFRASRRGDLAVMSLRYPRDKLEVKSSDYVKRVLRFISEDIKDKRVLEVGSGIGRITRKLIKVCSHITCVDLCERMHTRNAQALGANRSKVSLETCFIQDFDVTRRFDVAVCSLVLIHNVEQVDFEAAIRVMCQCADSVFVFEDATEARQASPHTRLLSEAMLREAFAKYGFSAQRTARYQLFEDVILFLKFVRAEEQAGTTH